MKKQKEHLVIDIKMVRSETDEDPIIWWRGLSWPIRWQLDYCALCAAVVL